jgi:ankyrin repeat protein
MHGHKEIVQMLLQHKHIDVNLQDRKGSTALTYASERGDKEMFEMLEAAVAKAKANKRDE